MDKKMIEEMAKIIDNNHGFIVSSVETAQALYNAGYRKIPEGAVVLTAEQFSDYLTLKSSHKNAVERCEKLQSDNERLYKNIGKFKDIVRKEMAEKFAERLKEVLGSRFNYIDSLIKSKIDEVCKEITEVSK